MSNTATKPTPIQEATPSPPRYARRLTDQILLAFHQACDQSDFEVAERLLAVLEGVVARHIVSGRERRVKDSLVAAYERLWALRHPMAQ